MAKVKKGKSKRSKQSPRISKKSTIDTNQIVSNQIVTNQMVSTSPSMIIILIVVYGVAILINYFTLTWLWKLEEISCVCSDNWMRYYIKYFLYTYFIMLLIAILLNIYKYTTGSPLGHNSIISSFIPYILFALNLFGFANIIISIIYIDQLKKQDCECSEDIKREVYWYYNITKLSLSIFIILLSIASMILMQ